MSLDGSDFPQPSVAETGALSPTIKPDALDAKAQALEASRPESQIGQGNLGRLKEAQQTVALTEQGVALRENEVSTQLAAVYALGGKLSEALNPKRFPVTRPFGQVGYVISMLDKNGNEILPMKSAAAMKDLTASQVVREHQDHVGEFLTPDGNTLKVSTYDTRFQSYRKEDPKFPLSKMVPDGEPKPGFTGLFSGIRITDPSLPEGSELILEQILGHVNLRVSRRDVNGSEANLFSVTQKGPDNEGVVFGGSDARHELQDNAEWVDLAQRRIQYSLDHAGDLTLKGQSPVAPNTSPVLPGAPSTAPSV